MLKELRQKIKDKGGFVNAHSHLDRANTARFFSKEEQYKFLEEKWKLVDRIKKNSNYWAYYSRIDQAVSDQLEKGVSTICSFVDVDEIATNKAYIASKEVAEKRKHDIALVTAMQTLKGVLNPKLSNFFLGSLICKHLV